jgi:hypothetical protein
MNQSIFTCPQYLERAAGADAESIEDLSILKLVLN